MAFFKIASANFGFAAITWTSFFNCFSVEHWTLSLRRVLFAKIGVLLVLFLAGWSLADGFNTAAYNLITTIDLTFWAGLDWAVLDLGVVFTLRIFMGDAGAWIARSIKV